MKDNGYRLNVEEGDEDEKKESGFLFLWLVKYNFTDASWNANERRLNGEREAQV